MSKNLITEEKVIELLNELLSEETSKVSRTEYGRVLFKVEELHSSLVETIKEFNQLENSIPNGLKTLTNGRMRTISLYLQNSQNLLTLLKERVISHKKRASKSIIDKGADVSNFGDPSKWQSSERADREIR